MRNATRANHPSLRLLIALGLLLILMAPIAVTAAGGKFTDDDTSIFEADIEWIAANGITVGCNPPEFDHYCPGTAVTRGQMAAFMHRLATNQVVDAATAVTADSATDADTLDGHSPSDFASSTHTHGTMAPSSDGFSVYYEGERDVVGLNFWETALELTDLPAGNYFVIAEAHFGTSEIMTVANPQCQLVAGTATDHVDARLQPNGSRESFTLTLVSTFDTDGNTVQLDCRDWGEAVSMADPRLTAIRLGNLTNTEE